MCDKEGECESCNCEGVSEDMYEYIKHEMLVVIKKLEYLDENDYFEMAATLEEMETQMRIEDYGLDEYVLQDDDDDDDYYDDDDDDDCTSYVLSDRLKAEHEFNESLSKYMKNQADIIEYQRGCNDEPCLISFGGENYPYRTIPLSDPYLQYNIDSTGHSTDTMYNY